MGGAWKSNLTNKPPRAGYARTRADKGEGKVRSPISPGQRSPCEPEASDRDPKDTPPNLPEGTLPVEFVNHGTKLTRNSRNDESLEIQAQIEVPPEGRQQTLLSTGNTLVFAIVVAENAAKQAQFDAKQPQATACDAERACAIDLWIARCPVKTPEAIMVGIRALVRAASTDSSASLPGIQ